MGMDNRQWNVILNPIGDHQIFGKKVPTYCSDFRRARPTYLKVLSSQLGLILQLANTLHITKE